jgi:hypothetical protein
MATTSKAFPKIIHVIQPQTMSQMLIFTALQMSESLSVRLYQQ